MPTVTVHNSHPRLRVDQRAIARHVRHVLDAMERRGALVDVSLVDDAQIHALNHEWRGVDDATDVLSFALEDEGPALPVPMLGDVIVSLDTAKRQAAALQRALRARGDDHRYSLRDETLFLVTHGVLHLLGFDHVEPADAEVMEAHERALVATFTEVDVQQLDRSDHAR